MRNSWTRRATTWALLGAFLGTLPGAPAAIAAPEGERVVKGKAEFERSGKHTRITTKSRETIVDYDRFGIAEDESVRIDQPNKRSRILNRVRSGDESRIDGALSSNGTVYILNPAGVFIGDRAVVDVGGLMAGAGALSNKDFMKGVDRFTDVTGDVDVAAGADVRATRNVLLVGRSVENLGSISTERGMVAMVAGENVLLTRHGGHTIIRVDGPGEAPAGNDFALTQAGEIQSQRVTLAAGDAYSLAMNHTGVTRAQEIHVQAEGDGLVQVAGTLDASNATGQGGHIRVQGGRIAVQDAALDASGASGGGDIRVGGNLRGTGDMPSARRVYVGEDAELRADATASGDGGMVIVYADEQTSFYGSLSARGGPQGGDGGFAEISGRSLAAQGDIDLGAPQGKTGTLLYDPDKIVIIGGSPVAPAVDGSDDPDERPDQVAQSRLGQVLSGDTGELVGDAFQIYESEIEGTNANIVLEATNRIDTQGSFVHDSSAHPESGEDGYEGNGFVVILPGNSLTLRTTGTTAPSGVTSDNDQDLIGIDLTSSADGNNLTWRVSDGGNITIETNLNSPQNPSATAPKASIQVGKLESKSARFESDDRFDLDLPVIADRSIVISAGRGDIEVHGIEGSGENAAPPVDDGNPDTVDRGRSPSGGAEITITSEQGNIQTFGPVNAKGGSGTGEGLGNQGSQGFDGAEITIATDAGNVTVNGSIDVSGGDGNGAISRTQAGLPPLTGGGQGGTITLAAKGGATEGKLEVLADLTAKGGRGLPHRDDTGAVQATLGGVGGAMAMSATQTVKIGTPGALPPDRIILDASGGDGSGFGGSARNDFTLEGVPGPNLTRSFRITGIAEESASQPNTIGPVEIYGDLIARGGNARQFAENPAYGNFPEAELFGGAGGGGGGFVVLPNSLVANEMFLDLSGGSGSLTSLGVDPPLGLDGSVLPVGGNGGDVSIVSIVASKQIDLGGTGTRGIVSRGGDAVNGAGGSGGSVNVTAGNPDEKDNPNPDPAVVIRAGDIDVSGGDATPEDFATETTLPGGTGGAVTLDARERTVGRVLLRGRLGGDGGTGVDGKTDALLRAEGADVTLSAVGAIQVDESVALSGGSAPASVVVSGSNVTLDAPKIGGRGDDPELAPVPIAGTAREKQQIEEEGEDPVEVGGEDIATVASDGTIAIEVRSENGLPDDDGDPEALERLNVVVRKETGTALVRRGGAEILRSLKAGASPGSRHTIQTMRTGNDDPLLSYRLDVDVAANTSQPVLEIARGAVALGTAGGEIINGGLPNLDRPTDLASNRGAIVGSDSGTGAHVTSAGTVRLEGTTLGDDDPAVIGDPLEFAASGTDAILRLDARGEIDGEVLETGSGAFRGFHGIEIVQHDAGAASDIAMAPAGDGIHIASIGTVPAPMSSVDVVTTGSGSGFSYRLAALGDDSVAEAVIAVDRLQLGGDGYLAAQGDVFLRGTTTPVRTNGHALTLISATGDIRQESTNSVSIDMTGGSTDGRELVLLADDDVGATNAPLRTRGVNKLAGQTIVGSFMLENQDDGSGLHITRLAPKDPALLTQPANAPAVLGIRAGSGNEPGSIEIVNAKVDPDGPDARIVFSELTEGLEFSQPHLRSFDDIRLKADAIEIENPRFFETDQPVVGKVFVPLNDARIIATNDVVFEGPVRTSLESEAEHPVTGEDVFIPGNLLVQANGTTTFGGNVGGELGSEAGYRLARLDTTAASAGGANGDTLRTFRVGQALFRGTLDGPARVQIEARDLSGNPSDDDPDPNHVASVTFDGDLGGRRRLGGLVVEAEQIHFASADRVVAAGDVLLDTNQSETPPDAAIFDTRGGLSIETGGAFQTGVNDKLTVLGPLSIRAASVNVGDVNAARELSVDSPNIAIRARAGAPIRGRDGEILEEEDRGTDWVADRMRLSSTPTILGPNGEELENPETVRLGVGGGGISAPAGVFQAAEVVYFTPGVKQVTAGDMQATTGHILDLQATGRAVVGNPAEDLPRERPLTDPSLPPRYSDEGPAPAPGVDANQLLAFLRCGDAAGPSAECDAADAAQLASVLDWPDSALATPRAEQIAASYREMRSRDLSAAFDAAGAGFREAQGFGEFDPAAFARYLEQSPDHPEARAAIHRLAGVLVEIDLLGLPADDLTQVRREIAGALAAEADLPGFDTDAVLEAVEATPIELPTN